MSATSALALAIGTAAVFGVLALMFALVAFAARQQRLRAEALAAEVQEHFALVASTPHLGLWSWDVTMDRIAGSRSAHRILGIEDDGGALMLNALLHAIHPEDQEEVLHAIRALAGAGGTVERELRIVGEGQEDRWIIVKACAYRNAQGVVRRVCGYLIDDTPRKRATEDLHKQQQNLTHLSRVGMLGELSGSLAHELQQPLTAILCNAQAAQFAPGRELKVEDLREILQEIVNDAQHAGEIIQRLRALFIRGERQTERIGIGEVIRDVLSLARSTLTQRNVEVSTRIDEGIPEIPGVRVELQQVLLNLILNASESMRDNSARDRRIEIVAELDTDARAVRTSVLDCGKGVDCEPLDRVFDPFLTTKKDGLGLGLAICRSIIDAHQGEIWAANRAGRGAAFHFQLPVTTKESANERPRSYRVHSG
jgi:two-component system, LuxR family, sensor kinase FixL